jgi:LPS export ABC transporter protein LptC
MTRSGGAAAFAALLAAGCSGEKPQEAAVSPAPTLPSAAAAAPSPSGVPIVLHAQKVGSRYIYLTKQKGNRLVYVLRADSETGRYFGANTGRSEFVRPHIIFYGADGKRLTADAPEGTVIERDKAVRMSGGVTAVDQNGMTLTSDSLRYDDPTELLHGQGNVVLHSPRGEELRGDSLDWNLRDGRINVSGTP